MRLYIKNMICNRCILVVKQELEKLNIDNCKVALGEVETVDQIPKEKTERLRENLANLGFELLDNAKQQLIEKIKNIIIKQVHYNDEPTLHNYSEILSKSLHKDYTYLSGLFSDVEGITIEKYIINQKIERVKELIIYDELSLGEIAYKLGYSSVAHLSNQFKKVTGLTPSHFKQVGQQKRKPLDKIINMKNAALVFLAVVTFYACSEKQDHKSNDVVIAAGQMPNLVKDKEDNLHLVYGSGDSIMYSSSSNQGKTFSTPALISVLPELAASHTRGPQIAATTKGLTVIACNSMGDIFSFAKAGSGKWEQTGKVNDVDTTAKEGLIALGGEGENAFAAWLDLRENKQNKIYGAKTNDGGKKWSKNTLLYASPDTTVCECCKPSVVVKGKNVYVMFRNWLQGNRDMYLIKSTDAGSTFGQAKKLGNGSWKLNGCPMDGGDLAVSNRDEVQTVWRREDKIYSAIPGEPEKEIGEGKGCTLTTTNGKNVYAWTENGEVVVIKPQGQKKVLGKGSQPILRALNNEHVICVWENEKQIHEAVLDL